MEDDITIVPDFEKKFVYLFNLLDKMEIEGNIIRVELLANTSNTNHTLFRSRSLLPMH